MPEGAVVRVRVTRFRYALGWVFILLGAITLFGVAAWATTQTDAHSVDSLHVAALVCPLPFGLAGIYLLVTSRFVTFDLGAKELRAGKRTLPFDRLRAMWLLTSGNPVAGQGSRFQYAHWRLTLITDDIAAPLQEAVRAAAAELAGSEGDAIPFKPHLKAPGVLDALKAPPAGALVPLIDAAPEEVVRRQAQSVGRAIGLPLIDMSDPRAPILRSWSA